MWIVCGYVVKIIDVLFCGDFENLGNFICRLFSNYISNF